MEVIMSKPKESFPTIGEAIMASEHQEAIDYFYVKYEEEMGYPYHFSGGKDGKAIKTLLKMYGSARLKRLIDHLFVTDNPFIIGKGGRTVSSLLCCVNELNQEMDRPSQDKEWRP